MEDISNGTTVKNSSQRNNHVKKPSFLLYVVLPTILVAVFAFGSYVLVERSSAEIISIENEKNAETTKSLVQEKVNAGIVALDGIRSYWVASDETPSEQDFNEFAGELYPNLDGFLALQWVDADFVVRYAYPLEGPNLDIIGFDNKLFPNRLQPIIDAKESRAPVSTQPIFLSQGVPGVVIFNPIFRGDEYLGSAVGVIRLDSFLQNIEDVLIVSEFQAGFSVGSTVFSCAADAIYTEAGLKIVRPGGGTEAVENPFRIPSGEDVFLLEIPFVNMTWNLHLLRTHHPGSDISIIAMVAGLAFTFSIVLIMSVLYFQRRKLVKIALREKDFISLVSHQLKGPIGQIIWGIETAKEGARLKKVENELLDGAIATAARANRLVNELLNISRFDRGAIQLELEDVSAQELLKALVEPHKSEAKKKKIKIQTAGDIDTIFVTDRLKASEALGNILDNALRYAPEGSTIMIEVRKSSKTGDVIISDTGGGIPKSEQPYIFERASIESKKKFEQSGLGLYLTKIFIELLGGRISFTSNEKGTTFTVSLPLR